MLTILQIILVLLAISLVVLVLLQRGTGATAGAAFGSGASGTVFGAAGAASFLTRATAVVATGFFAISLIMAVMVSRGIGQAQGPELGVVDESVQQRQQAPATAPEQDAAGVTPAAPESGQQAESAADDVPSAVGTESAQSGASTNADVPQPTTRDDSSATGSAEEDDGGSG